jgi:DNA polymerase III alpha subunit
MAALMTIEAANTDKILIYLTDCKRAGNARAALFSGLDAAVSAAQKEQADKASGQVGLFGMLGGGGPPPPSFRPPDEQEWSLGKRLGFERDAVGFYLSGHPVEAFAENLGRYVTCRLGDLSDEREGAEVTVPGMATASRQVRTKRGDKMGFVTLDDGTGTVECVFFSDAWERSARAFKDDGVAVLVKGELEKTADGCKILAESAEPLAELIESRAREVHICVDSPGPHRRPGHRAPRPHGALRREHPDDAHRRARGALPGDDASAAAPVCAPRRALPRRGRQHLPPQ